MKLDDLKSVIGNPLYNYQRGDNLFDFEGNLIPHPESTNIFHVRNSLASYMLMENLNFQKKDYSICPEVSSMCGLESALMEQSYHHIEQKHFHVIQFV